MFVLDSHCDTPLQIIRGRDLSKDNELAHIDIPKLKRGGVDAAFLHFIFLPNLKARLHMNMQYIYMSL